MQEPETEPAGQDRRQRSPRQARLRFGTLELDPAAEELRRDGGLVRLTSQPLRLLSLLASRHGELVTRQQIRDHLWQPGVHVEFDQAINALVRDVRRALRDDATSPRFIATVPRRGYRFVAPVQLVEPAAHGPRAPGGELPRRAPVSGPIRPRLVALLSLLAATAALWVVIAIARHPGTPPRAAGGRLAVLPFTGLGENPGGSRLATGLTEELIASLGRDFRGQLEVIAPSSALAFRAAQRPPRDFAAELGAEYFFVGTLRRQGERLRITARLSRTRDASVLWVGGYDRTTGDLLEIQRLLARDIAHALALNLLPPDARASDRPREPAAVEPYLKSQHLLRQSHRGSPSAGEARRLLRRTVELDPGFAAAWVDLARATLLYGTLDVADPEARADLRRALALDDESASAHLLTGALLFYRDLDFDGSRAAFDRALEINPSYAEAHHALASWFSARGRHDEALAALARAKRLDPLSAEVLSDTCWLHLFARRSRTAAAGAAETLARYPNDPYALECRWQAQAAAGELAAAVESARVEGLARRSRLQPGRDDADPVLAAEAAAWEGFLTLRRSASPRDTLRGFWSWRSTLLQMLRERPSREEVTADQLAVAQAQLGHPELAIELLERSFSERAGWRRPFLAVDPEFDPLRGLAGFERLERRVRVRAD